MKFLYKNFEGEVYEWEIINPVDDGVYISGVAIPKLGYKTFRKKRILKYFPDDYVITPRPIIRKESINNIEVCFTGFLKEKRAELERMSAEEFGILVRKNVTLGLDFLVIGQNAGPKKMEKAQEQGTIILDEDAFKTLLKTGEINF